MIVRIRTLYEGWREVTEELQGGRYRWPRRISSHG